MKRQYYKTSRYINQFLRLKCAPDVIASRVFPNVKEITESMAAFSAVRRIMGSESFGNHKIQLVDVGAGKYPRTALLFAHMTRWTCWAIDPRLSSKSYSNVRGLHTLSEKIESTMTESEHPVVVCAVHSHVPLDVTLSRIKAPEVLVVAMPCCVELKLRDRLPSEDYNDIHCWSPCNRVVVYKGVNTL